LLRVCASIKELLDHGVAKECARFVLPLATPTRIYMSGSCRSWIHYIQLRSANGTQKEHMEIAEECKKIFQSSSLQWQKHWNGSKYHYLEFITMATYPVVIHKTGEKKKL
jgi:flavin-dependent thymidylate synthase